MGGVVVVLIVACVVLALISVAMGVQTTGEIPGQASLPDGGAQYATNTYQSATFAAGDLTPLTGTERMICFENTGTTPANLQTRSAAQMFADTPNARAGMTYTLFIRNSSGSANTATITAGSNVTLSGTMTIAQNVTRMFTVTFTDSTHCTIRSMGLFAAGA